MDKIMYQNVDLMRNLLIWIANADRNELIYCEKQFSLNDDGSIDKIGLYNQAPGTSLIEGTYDVIKFKPLPVQTGLNIGRESHRDIFLWYGIYDDIMSESYMITYKDGTEKWFTKIFQYLPSGYPIPKYWMGYSQFDVTYNLNQLDLAKLIKVRYFYTEEEWMVEPPLSMYLTPQGSDFVSYIINEKRWEDLKNNNIKYNKNKLKNIFDNTKNVVDISKTISILASQCQNYF